MDAVASTPTEIRAIENPYIAARREWNERYGEYIARERAWRSIAILCGVISVLAVVGIVWMGVQNKLVPYVVEVDKLGSAVAVQRADSAALPDSRIIRSQLARWITDLRTVYVDAAAERTAITDAYAMINQGGAAFGMLNDYMRQEEHQPFLRAQSETASVEVQSVLPLTSDTWRVEWVETVRDLTGHEKIRTPWSATISVLVHPPTDERAILRNPTGLYVQTLNWAQRL
jgi:type IV secretory pathway TrbF-like protein